MVGTVSYEMTRGLLWERLVVIKNRRTHRVFTPSDARCTIDLGTSKYNVPFEVTREGGLLLTLTPDQTLDIPEGSHDFDIVCPVRGYWRPVAKGTITVTTLESISPIQDGQQMEIRFKKGEDYRTSFTWTDADGVLLTVTDAYAQAKSAAGTTVLDLRWFAAVPNEAAILALSAEQRGYLAASTTGESLDLHISDANSIPAGSYDFDLFVKGSNGDWTLLTAGQVVVEPSVSVKPT